MKFELNMDEVIKGLSEKEAKTKAALGLYGDTVAKQMESYSKNNAPWVDRTSIARKSLNGSSSLNGDIVRCQISHGVDYGIYLEVCNEQKYAILEPTVKAIGPKALKGLSKLFK